MLLLFFFSNIFFFGRRGLPASLKSIGVFNGAELDHDLVRLEGALVVFTF